MGLAEFDMLLLCLELDTHEEVKRLSCLAVERNDAVLAILRFKVGCLVSDCLWLHHFYQSLRLKVVHCVLLLAHLYHDETDLLALRGDWNEKVVCFGHSDVSLLDRDIDSD